MELNNLDPVWMLLSVELESKGFGHDELDQFYNGYGQYVAEGMTELFKFIYQNPESSKEEIIAISRKIQNYFWNMDCTNTEKRIRQISEEREYSAPELLIKSAMTLVSIHKRGTYALELFEEIKDERELAIEMINRLEEWQAFDKAHAIFDRAENHVCEIFTDKSYDMDFLEDVKFAMEYTFHTRVPVEYEVIVRAVESAETEADLRKRMAPIMAVIYGELHIDQDE